MVKMVKVRLMKAGYEHEFTAKEYSFLTDLELKGGDLVVVDTTVGVSIGEVRSTDGGSPAKAASKWVICKIDLSGLDKKRKRFEEILALRNEMDSKRKQLEEEAIFKMLAKEDSSMAELMDKYDSLLKEDL